MNDNNPTITTKKEKQKGRLKYYGVCYAFSLPYFLIFCIFTVCPVLISRHAADKG